MTESIAPKRILILCSALVTATLLWAGSKSWNKPYTSWDAKDVQQIMTNSPWVAATSMRRSWHQSRDTTVVRPVQPEISGRVRTGPGVMGNTASNTGGTDANQVSVHIYWYSSRVIRAASAREGVLRGTIDQPGAQKLIDVPQTDYEIVLRMDDMTPFMDKDENFYQQNAFLQMGRSKLKLPSSKVEYEHMGTTSEAVVFSFPKKTADGAPTITSDETDVTFSCKIADQIVRAKFKPNKMVDQFGPDL